MRSRSRASGWILPLVATLTLGVHAPARAAAGLELAFAGPCTLGQPIAYPTLLPTSKGSAKSFTCWAGSTVPAGLSGIPTFFEAVQRDQPGKAYRTPGDTKDAAIACAVAACKGGMTMTGSIMPGLVGGPWCTHNTGTFNMTITPTSTFVSGGWILFGDTLVITGTVNHGVQSGPFVGTAHLEPNVFLDASCLGANKDFYMAGGGGGAKFGPGLPFDQK